MKRQRVLPILLLLLSGGLAALLSGAGVSAQGTPAVSVAGWADATSDPPQVTLSLVPDRTAMEPGEVVKVDIKVNSAVALRGLQLSLHFPAALLEASGFEEGPYFKTWAEAHGGMSLVLPNPPPYDNVNGKAGIVSINVMGGEAGGAQGEGLVASFRFTAKPGTSGQQAELSLADVVVGDANLDPVTDLGLNGTTLTIGAVPPTATHTPMPQPTTVPQPTTPAPGPKVTVSLDPANPSQAPGDTLRLAVKVTTTGALGTMQTGLRFPPALLEATGFEEGPFFKSWAEAHGASTLLFPPQPKIDNTAGTIGAVSISVLGGQGGGPSGEGVFGVFLFKVKPGTGGQQGELKLEGVVVGDANAEQVMDVTTTGAQLSVSGGAAPTPSATPTGEKPEFTIYLPVAGKGWNSKKR